MASTPGEDVDGPGPSKPRLRSSTRQSPEAAAAAPATSNSSDSEDSDDGYDSGPDLDGGFGQMPMHADRISHVCRPALTHGAQLCAHLSADYCAKVGVQMRFVTCD